MKTEKRNSMPRSTAFLLILLMSLSAMGCELVISQAETNGELPDNPEDCTVNPDLCAENPNDPDNPGFTLPTIQLSNGLSFDTPFEIQSNQVVLEWSIVDGNGNPIEFDYNFSYRYAAPDENISDKPFTEIGTDESVTLPNLAETFNDEFYDFEINATYADRTDKDTTFSGQFSVNAFQSRGFLFSPYTLQSNNDGTYTAKIYLDEVSSSDDITAFSLEISYNGSYFNLTEDDIVVNDAAGDFLNRDNAQLIVFKEVNASTIVLDVGMAGNNLTPLSGGGAVCEITFTPTSSFPGQAFFGITSNSVLKNSNGADIEILGFGNAEITQ